MCDVVCVCVCVLNEEGNKVVASRAVEVAQTAAYLTGYSDCLTGFSESSMITVCTLHSLPAVKGLSLAACCIQTN